MGSCASCFEGFASTGVVKNGMRSVSVQSFEEEENDDDVQATFVVPARLELIGYIGSGAYGIVASFKDTSTGRDVAVKRMNVTDDLTEGKKDLREVHLMRYLAHKHVLHIEELLPPSSPDFDEIYMVMRQMDTDLFKMIYGDTVFTDALVRQLMSQVLLGVAYLHSARVVHRDLKPANVLVDAEGAAKLCDFGLSRVLDDAAAEDAPRALRTAAETAQGLNPPRRCQRRLTTVVITLWYRAPEVILYPSHYGFAIDIWSVGCVLAEMLKAQAMFDGTDQLGQIRTIVEKLGSPGDSELAWLPADSPGREFLSSLPPSPKADWSTMLSHASRDAQAFASELLIFDPLARLSALDALTSSYLQASVTPEDLAGARHLGPPVDWAFDDFELTKAALQNQFYKECAVFHPEIYDRDAAVLAAAGIERS